MNDGVTKSKVSEILKGMGFAVREIPKRSDRRTPDFEVSDLKDKYLVELKEKDDDPELVKNERAQLDRGELVTKAQPLGPRNKLDAIIESGVEQMTLHDPSHALFHVLWLECKGDDPSHHWKRFHSTLFGIETLFSHDLPQLATAYYFKNSAFFRWKDQLDAVILSANENGQLCVNSLSARASTFRSSELFLKLKEGLCDPEIEERTNQAMIVDSPVNRSDENMVLAFLKTKHGLSDLVAMPLQEFSGTKRLDR